MNGRTSHWKSEKTIRQLRSLSNFRDCISTRRICYIFISRSDTLCFSDCVYVFFKPKHISHICTLGIVIAQRKKHRHVKRYCILRNVCSLYGLCIIGFKDVQLLQLRGFDCFQNVVKEFLRLHVCVACVIGTTCIRM